MKGITRGALRALRKKGLLKKLFKVGAKKSLAQDVAYRAMDSIKM